MKKTFFCLVISLCSLALFAQTARVQVAHNSADALASQVDVYVNGFLQLSDVAFRTVSPFTDLPAGIPLTVSIAPGGSTSVADAFYNENFNLTSGETYIIIADGIESPTGYSPAPPFSLEVYEMAREVANNPGMIDVLVHQGATDLPIVDVYETGQGLGLVIDDISYADYDGYLEFPVANYVVQLNDQSGLGIAAYVAPLESLGLQGEAVTVVGSGFLDPSQNSNGPAFGLYAFSSQGGPMIPLPPSPLLTVDRSELNAISVFPNPTNGLLIISGLPSGDYAIRIVDMAGAIISEINGNTETYQFNMSSFASGLYIISVTDETGISDSFTIVKD